MTCSVAQFAETGCWEHCDGVERVNWDRKPRGKGLPARCRAPSGAAAEGGEDACNRSDGDGRGDGRERSDE